MNMLLFKMVTFEYFPFTYHCCLPSCLFLTLAHGFLPQALWALRDAVSICPWGLRMFPRSLGKLWSCHGSIPEQCIHSVPVSSPRKQTWARRELRTRQQFPCLGREGRNHRTQWGELLSNPTDIGSPPSPAGTRHLRSHLGKRKQENSSLSSHFDSFSQIIPG